MNAEERFSYLLESVWTPTNRGVVLRDVYAAAGEHEGLVALTLRRVKNPILSDEMSDSERNQVEVLAEQVSQACVAMSTVGGLSLSDEKSQSLIDVLAQIGDWPDVVRDAVKALGGVWQARWKTIPSYAAEPTLESVQAEIDRDATAAWYSARDAVVREGLHDLTITTQQQVRDVFGGA